MNTLFWVYLITAIICGGVIAGMITRSKLPDWRQLLILGLMTLIAICMCEMGVILGGIK